MLLVAVRVLFCQVRMLMRCLEISKTLKKEALQNDGTWHDYGVEHIDRHVVFPSSSHEMSSFGKSLRDARQIKNVCSQWELHLRGFVCAALYELNYVFVMCSL